MSDGEQNQALLDRIRDLEREGNAALANGLVLQARRKFRVADALRLEANAA